MPELEQNLEPKKISKKRLYHLILRGITFIFISSILVIGGKIWINTYYKLQDLHNTFSLFQTNYNEFQKNLGITLAAQEKVLDQLSRENISSQASRIKIRELIFLADLQLKIDGNLNSAIELLHEAKKRIAGLNSDKLENALEQDISALSALPKINAVGVIQQIDQMIGDITALPLTTHLDSSPLNTSTINDASLWGRIQKNLGGLKDLFIIQRIDHPLPPLESNQVLSLQQNIISKLLQAEWALLRNDHELYSQSLTTAVHWLDAYHPNHSAILPIKQKISEISGMDLSRHVPELSSLRLLEAEKTPP